MAKKRMIDLDKTLQRLEKEVWWTESEKSAIRQFLYKSKVKDAVEVVRCGECIHRGNLQSCDGRPLDWYCPNGVRKGDGEC